ncbi:hypothetical protein [Chryseobacterium nakagawai]|uniref:hypothetical protein n=1 Tax=Chryseobacterium nakagawai TaxID=1241982 RepID=UPI0013DD9722|nr:hypothetical protein [Chryseobacterium nakagawai]
MKFKTAHFYFLPQVFSDEHRYEEYVFTIEGEMVNYFIENKGLDQTFYWNKSHNN